MAYKKDLVSPKTLSSKAMERVPFILNDALRFAEENIDNLDDHKAGERAFKIFSKILDKFVPDPPKPKNNDASGEVSSALSDMMQDYLAREKAKDLSDVVDAEVSDGNEESS